MKNRSTKHLANKERDALENIVLITVGEDTDRCGKIIKMLANMD
jgi:hypothetical protein